LSRVLLVSIALLTLVGAWLWLGSRSCDSHETRPAGAQDQPAPTALERSPLTDPGPTSAPSSSPTTRETVSDANGLTLSGRVVDDLGEACPSFMLRGLHAPEPEREPGPADELERTYQNTDGTFRLDGLVPGPWELVAQSEAHAPSEIVRMMLPASAPVTFVVPREATVNGVVLDASGASAAGATVELERLPVAPSARQESATTDEHGAFRIPGLRRGFAALAARGPGGTPSAQLVVELVPGRDIVDLVLRLGAGSPLTGEVVSTAGRPLGGVKVRIAATRMDEERETDPAGRFEIAHVPAGLARLSAETTEGVRLEAEVEVVAGEAAHVRLSAPAELVHVHGRVLAGTESVALASIGFSAPSNADSRTSRASSCESDQNGAYQTDVRGAGRYLVSVVSWRSMNIRWNAVIDVPAAEDFACDISAAVGRISGRVTDATGAPLAGIMVLTEPEPLRGAQYDSGSSSTDAEGRYEIIAPLGRLAVTTGYGLRNTASEHPCYAGDRVNGLVLGEGGGFRDIDLVLVEGGTLEAHVHNADGSPASRAIVLVEQEGRRIAFGTCDEEGFARIPCVAGPLLVRAVGSPGTTREPAEIEVPAGETRQIELELGPAVLVHVLVRDAHGAPVDSEVSALDVHGHEQHASAGDHTGEAWLGPLAPGRYTVRAQREQKTAERPLEVIGTEKKLELELVFQ